MAATPSWTLVGQLVNAAGNPQAGVKLQASRMGAADTVDGSLAVVQTLSTTSGTDGKVSLILPSFTGALWRVQVALDNPTTLPDPGIGAVVDLKSLSPAYVPAYAEEGQASQGAGVVGVQVSGDQMTFKLSNGAQLPTITIPTGPVGSLTMGTVTTGAVGQPGSASVTGDPGSQKLNLVMPVVDPADAIRQAGYDPAQVAKAGEAWDKADNAEGIATGAVTAAEAAQHAAEVAEGAAFATVDSGTAALISNPTVGPQTIAALRSRERWVNVLDFGAKGDGTTDDAPAFNNATSAAASQGGGIVYAPFTSSGYALGSVIVVYKGVVLQGPAGGVTLKATGAPRPYMASFQGGTADGAYENLRFNANEVITSAIISGIGPLTSPRVSRCSFLDTAFTAPFGVQIVGAVTDPTISDCTFDGIDSAVFVAYNVVRPTVTHCRITNWRTRGIFILGDATNSTIDATISDNLVSGLAAGGVARYPILVSGEVAKRHIRPKVTGNTVIGPGINYAAGGTADQISVSRSENLVVSGNISTGGGDMGITVALENSGGVVTGNVCYSNSVSGICIGDGSTTLDERLSITGNTCLNNGQYASAPAAYKAGISVFKGSKLVISGNVVDDNQGTKTQNYGVSLYGSSNVLLGPNQGSNALALHYTGAGGNSGISAVSTVAVP